MTVDELASPPLNARLTPPRQARPTTSSKFLIVLQIYQHQFEQQKAPANMGIKQLFSIIKEEAPDAFKEGEIKNQFGRKVAIVSCLDTFCEFIKKNCTDFIARMRMQSFEPLALPGPNTL